MIQVQPISFLTAHATALRLTLIACSLIALGCESRSERPPEPTAAASHTENEVSAAGNDGGAQVTGTAPISADGSLTVVLLEPQSSITYDIPAEPVQMDQLGMEFLPPVLLAVVGQPVNFHNSEDVLHNVRVYNIDTQDTAFNISTPIGGTYEHHFDSAGTYRVACDIHPAMGASVVVTATPHATVADRSGNFTLNEVEPGNYTAIVHAGQHRTRQAVTITAGTTELSLGSD